MEDRLNKHISVLDPNFKEETEKKDEAAATHLREAIERRRAQHPEPVKKVVVVGSQTPPEAPPPVGGSGTRVSHISEALDKHDDEYEARMREAMGLPPAD